MNYPFRHIFLSFAMAYHGFSLAQQLGQEKAKNTAQEKDANLKVEVSGSAGMYDARRDDTASKSVLTQAEIQKYGDNSIIDVLKRAPGVTVIAGSIRMRGLGNGYTQILVNGERPAAGFSIDILTPDQVEKIEIIRAASAEYSAQAIAGTINIVLRKTTAKPQRDIRVNGAHSTQADSLHVFGILADKNQGFSYLLNSTIGALKNRTNTAGQDVFLDSNGDLLQYRDASANNSYVTHQLSLQPRLSWKFVDDSQFNVGGFIQGQRTEGDAESSYSNRVGSFSNPEYIRGESTSGNDSLFLGGDINWVWKFIGGKADVKISASRGRVNSAGESFSYADNKEIILLRGRMNSSQYTTIAGVGKYTKSFADSHSLSTGWDVNRQVTEDYVERKEGFLHRPRAVIFENFEPSVFKVSAYAQDEWNLSKNWSLAVGARWENIRTDSFSNGLAAKSQTTNVVSPVAHSLYKFTSDTNRQMRIALTRTFKAPTISQLTARRYDSDQNSRFTPDSSGNPSLRPELANGIDVAYEHFWAPGALFSMSASQRQIRDYMRSKLVQDSTGRWLISPVNDGDARVRSFEAELKFPAKVVVIGSPNLEFRFHINRNWSQVKSVPAPNNRLDQQVPLSIIVGIDYREEVTAAGLNFAYRAGGATRMSEQQGVRTYHRHEIEGYWLYKFGRGAQVRFAVANLLGESIRSESSYIDAAGASRSTTTSGNPTRVSSNLELKF